MVQRTYSTYCTVQYDETVRDGARATLDARCWAMDDGATRVRIEGGGIATYHYVSAIRPSFCASGKVQEVAWLKREDDRRS